MAMNAGEGTNEWKLAFQGNWVLVSRHGFDEALKIQGANYLLRSVTTALGHTCDISFANGDPNDEITVAMTGLPRLTYTMKFDVMLDHLYMDKHKSQHCIKWIDEDRSLCKEVYIAEKTGSNASFFKGFYVGGETLSNVRTILPDGTQRVDIREKRAGSDDYIVEWYMILKRK